MATSTMAASNSFIASYLLPPSTPVVHPSHLEGDPLLATEILPGPPSLVSIQQRAGDANAKKPAAAAAAVGHSYLPASDPGTTYVSPFGAVVSGSTGLVTPANEPVDGPRPKRARIDKGRVQRTQRKGLASQNTGALASTSSLQLSLASPLIVDSEQDPLLVEDDIMAVDSRANSAGNEAVEESASSGKTQRSSRKRDKGKEKERGDGGDGIRIKEEPRTISLAGLPLDEQALSQANEDHCSACRSIGALVYCDGCPRAFHFRCLDPPMDASDIPGGDSRWFCPACDIRKNPSPKPPPSLFAPLLNLAQTSFPLEYELPDDIRTFFKDVVSAPNGVYVDGSEIRQARLNRFGLIDERDITKLKDRNGDPVLCFRCGKSALPTGAGSPAPPLGEASTGPTRRSTRISQQVEEMNGIISCDHCDLHFHIDCLSPPLATLPPLGKKWMCPNHVEQITGLTLRIPKLNAPPIEITKSGKFNNGNIEVSHPQFPASQYGKVAAEEVNINGRKYRVPERVIQLDFWEKLGRGNEYKEVLEPKSAMVEPMEISSSCSSPLTSLSELSDIEERDTFMGSASPLDDRGAAEVLFGLRSLRIGNPRHHRRMATIGTQTETVPPTYPVPANATHARPQRSKNTTPAISTPIFTTTTNDQAQSVSAVIPRKTNGPTGKRKVAGASKAAGTSASASAKPAPAPKKAKAVAAASTSDRELRRSSRKRGGDANGPVVVKTEEVDEPTLSQSLSAPPKSPVRPTRLTKTSSSANLAPEETQSASSSSRWLKRKLSATEEATYPCESGARSPTSDSNNRERRKIARTPSWAAVNGTSASANGAGSAPSPSTPTLKIRLPRLLNMSPAKQAE